MDIQTPLKYMKENDKYGVIIKDGRFAWDKQDEDEDAPGDITIPTLGKDPNDNVPAVTYRPARKTEKVDFSVQCDLGSEDEDSDDDDEGGRKIRGDSEKEFKPEGAITDDDDKPVLTDPSVVLDATRRKSWNEDGIKELIESAKSKRKPRKPPPENEVSSALFDMNFVLEKVR